LADQSELRQINRRRVLMAALRLGRASRSELARDVGLSAPTAGKIVDALLGEHVLSDAPHRAPISSIGEGTTQRVGRSARLVGRPRQLVGLSTIGSRHLAVQWGTVHTRLAPLQVCPNPTDTWSVEFRTPVSAGAWQDAVGRACGRVLSGRPDVVMVSVPGIVDEQTGRLLFSPNMRRADGQNIASLVRRVLPRAKVHVVQEIHCLALGVLGTEPAASDFLLVDFGHGVGSAAVVGGKIYRGNLPMMGEIGHTPVVGHSRPCGCGGVGCLETLVSRQALAESVLGRSLRKGRVASCWAEVVETIEAQGVTTRLGEALDAAGAGIAGAINALGIDRVILTGSVAELPVVVRDHISSAIRRSALWARFGSVDVQTMPRRRLAGLSYAMIDRVVAPQI